MASQLYIPLILLFSISFALIVGSNIAAEDQRDFVNQTTEGQTDTMADLMNTFISPELLAGTAVVSGAALIFSGSAPIVVAAASIAYISIFFLQPMSIIRGAGIPYPFDFIILGFMTLLVVTTVIAFIRGSS
jgi:hypothetical protein